MFESRRRRQNRGNLLKLLLFGGFFWLLIDYGFRESMEEVSDFGDLDNAHVKMLKTKNKLPFVKLTNETWRNKMIKLESEVVSEEKQLDSHEEMILREFLRTPSHVNSEQKNEEIFKEFMRVRKRPPPAPKPEFFYREVDDLDVKMADDGAAPANGIYYEYPDPNPQFKDGHVDPLITAVFGPAPLNSNIPLEDLRADLESMKDNLPPEHYQILLDEFEKEEQKREENSKPDFDQLIPLVPDDGGDDTYKEVIPLPDKSADLDDVELALNKLNPQKMLEISELQNINKESPDDLDVLLNPVEAQEASKSKETDNQSTAYSEEEAKLGENGEAVTLPDDLPDNIQKLVKEGWKNYEFNEYVSSMISLQRDLRDFRTDYCKDAHRDYSTDLPKASIIIVFYNEAWSTLIRSIYSILNRTPVSIVQEIILVDDCSDFEHLKGQLEEFVRQFEWIRIIRNTKREGLIKSRNRGALEATGEVLVFLDSHIECTIGWLEPLLDRIVFNESTVAAPIVENIDAKTFELVPSEHPKHVTLGGFHWNLVFHWFHIESKYFKNPFGPIETPTISGGLFAIKRDFFIKLGMFDPGLQIWGTENLELSFKTWMCGGRMEIVQCSHVGHVFRVNSPYKSEIGPDVMRKNAMRVANTWMDEYAVFYNYATGFDAVDYGNITDRLNLRNNLKCKSFKWYLKNVYPHRTVPDRGIAFGEIRNLGFNGTNCLEGKAKKESKDLKIKGCHGHGRDQFWMYYDGEIQRDNYCLTFDKGNVFTKHCRMAPNQMFTFDIDSQQLKIRSANKCLAMTNKFNLVMENCDSEEEGQKWKLEHLKEERVKEF